MSVNGHILLGQDLGPVAEGLLHLSGLSRLLGSHSGGGIVQAVVSALLYAKVLS